MLLHRVAALGRALMFVGGLALAALGSGTHADEPDVPEESRAPQQAVIESRAALPTDDVRGGEQVELVSVGVRSAVRSPESGWALAPVNRASVDFHGADALRWCDVIQCRRLGGALLLGFATPPPTHS